jgi:RNA-directed DNA polymerase
MTIPSGPTDLSRLKNLGLPRITNLEELSSEIRLSKGFLQKLNYTSDKHYFVYTLDKKSGGKERLRNLLVQ